MKESITQTDILRVSIDDLDTPNTPGWRAKYTIVEGNDHHNYEIETDPKTNEGILSVIKVTSHLKSLTKPTHLGFNRFHTTSYNCST